MISSSQGTARRSSRTVNIRQDENNKLICNYATTALLSQEYKPHSDIVKLKPKILSFKVLISDKAAEFLRPFRTCTPIRAILSSNEVVKRLRMTPTTCRKDLGDGTCQKTTSCCFKILHMPWSTHGIWGMDGYGVSKWESLVS